MKVILQERVANLGNVGDQVNVKPGYARNFLLPKDMAVQATPANIKAFEVRRVELEKKAEAVLATAQSRAKQLDAFSLTLTVQASDEGKLFGSIGPKDIADALVSAGHEVEKNEVDMPEGPIRQIGEHTVNLSLHSEVVAPITVIVNMVEKTH